MAKSKKTKLAVKGDKKELNTYILIDRSGSMAGKWDETISAINAYIDTMRNEDIKNIVTVAAFDYMGQMEYTVLRDKENAKKCRAIGSAEIIPRGMTPLYDAIGKMVNAVEADNMERTMLVVITDGLENNSREMNRDNVKAAMERCKARDWQIVFLGADFNAFDQASTVGVLQAQTLDMTAGNYGNAMRSMATSRTSYAATGQSVSFSAEDRAVAEGKKPKTTL